MKCYMKGQEKDDCLIEVTAQAGLTLYSLYHIYVICAVDKNVVVILHFVVSQGFLKYL